MTGNPARQYVTQYLISKDGTLLLASDCFVVDLDWTVSPLDEMPSDDVPAYVSAYAREHGRPVGQPAPGSLSVDEEHRAAIEHLNAALDQNDRAVRRVVAQKVKRVYPAAVTLVTFGEYNEDGLLHARCDRILDADHNILAESDELTDAWEELTDDVDPVLCETSELMGDQYLDEVEIDLTEWED
jgi:hypothetical protein